MALNTAESVIKFQADVSHDEAQRQLGICNSCRYCEGYCGAFQALTRYRSFDKAVAVITPVSTQSRMSLP